MFDRVREILGRCVTLFLRRRLEREMNEEMETHLVMQEEEFRRQGMSAAAARAAAKREFGGVAQTQEAYRERGGVPWLETAAKDIRYALRGLKRSPGFTAAAVLSLALGIGANTSVFSLVYALMLRMLPVERPEELVLLHVGSSRAGFASDDLYDELAARTDLFSGVLARKATGHERFMRSQDSQPETAVLESVSTNYFRVLGPKPALGRFFTSEDARQPAGQQLAVLSYDTWRNRFGGDPQVLGRSLRTERSLLTVVGVAPPDFHGIAVESKTEIWIPAVMRHVPGVSSLYVLARRRPEISPKQLQAALDAHTGWPGTHSEKRIEVRAGGIGLSFLRQEFGKPLEILMAAVGLVLLATCANLAHLLLARGATRRKEIALRYALGASRGRLIRQSLTESFLLAAAGCVAGTALAFLGARYLLLFIPAWRAGTLDAAPNGPVLAFTVVTALGAALVFGLAPALRSSAVDPVASLGSDAGASSGRSRLRSSLAVIQVAFSVVLVAMAGLFGQSLARMRAADLGFRHDSVVTFWISRPSRWSTQEEDGARQRFLAQAASLPGIASVSYSSPDMLQGQSWGQALRLEPGKPSVKAFVMLLGPRFLETVGGVPVQGREFDRNDTSAAPKVALVNQAFVRKYLPGDRDPLSHVPRFVSDEKRGGPSRQIVGVVRDIVHGDVRQRAEPTVYLPFSQMESPFGGPAIVVRGQLPAPALIQNLRRELAAIHPEMTATQPRTIRERIEESVYESRMLAAVSKFFGGLALLLAAVGLYGLTAYATARRSREIGIRIALGAGKKDVLRLVLRDALGLVAAGLAIGLAAAFVAGRAVSSILFGTHPADLPALLITVVLLLGVGFAAAWLPARRAAAMDPMRAVRCD